VVLDALGSPYGDYYGATRTEEKRGQSTLSPLFFSSTPRIPMKHNAVSVDDCGTAVDNLCIIRASVGGKIAGGGAASQDRSKGQTNERRSGGLFS